MTLTQVILPLRPVATSPGVRSAHRWRAQCGDRQRRFCCCCTPLAMGDPINVAINATPLISIRDLWQALCGAASSPRALFLCYSSNDSMGDHLKTVTGLWRGPTGRALITNAKGGNHVSTCRAFHQYFSAWGYMGLLGPWSTIWDCACLGRIHCVGLLFPHGR